MSRPEAPVLFLLNPAAGGGRARARLRAALDRRPALRRRSEVLEVRSREEAYRALSDRTAGALLVAAGGDGTVNLVGGALYRAGDPTWPMAVVPLGTGNAFARSLGVRSIGVALETIESGREIRVDVLATNHSACAVAFVSLSIGFESEALRGFARWRRWTRAAGLAATVPAALRARAGLEVALDGRRILGAGDRFYNFGLYNAPCYAFGLRVVPGTDLADGIAECASHRRAVAYWSSLGRAVVGRGPSGPPCRWRRAWIASTLPLQIDGEWIASCALEVRVDPQALLVRVPA